MNINNELVDESRKITKAEIEKQKNIVAKIMAKPELADEYMNYGYMQCEDWWIEPTVYFAFMLMLYLRGSGIEKTWSKEMIAQGRVLLKDEEDLLRSKKNAVN